MIPQSLGWWPFIHHCFYTLLSSLNYHALNLLYEISSRTCKHFPQCFFEASVTEINKTQKSSKFLHTYCDAYNARDTTNRRFVTSTVFLSNVTIIEWFTKKQSKTHIIISNAETITM